MPVSTVWQTCTCMSVPPLFSHLCRQWSMFTALCLEWMDTVALHRRPQCDDVSWFPNSLLSPVRNSGFVVSWRRVKSNCCSKGGSRKEAILTAVWICCWLLIFHVRHRSVLHKERLRGFLPLESFGTTFMHVYLIYSRSGLEKFSQIYFLITP